MIHAGLHSFLFVFSLPLKVRIFVSVINNERDNENAIV